MTTTPAKMDIPKEALSTNDHSQNGGISSESGRDSGSAQGETVPVKKTRRSTTHLKAVPETLVLREQIKLASEEYASGLDKRRPFTSDELEQHGRKLLGKMNLPEAYLGFAMVLIGNFFWKQQFLTIPFERRMLLLPHCLKHAEGCPADYDEFGLDCEKCGACSIADYKVRAEQLGYKVLVAEGSPVVLKIIVSGHIDGILGVACLNVLEKAIDKVLIAGVPSYAIPLHTGDCKNTSLDESWVWDVLEKYEPVPQEATRSYVPLMRQANRMFDDSFDRLLPPVRQGSKSSAALMATEAAAYDWLRHGGKRFRPFMTLAAFNAISDAGWTNPTGSAIEPRPFSDASLRVAMAIEAFHKASLVHDDIQDDDQFRYGRETLHRTQGTGMAINIGDYLIGLGYRLVSQARAEIGAEAAADILDRMSNAHLKLCDGQGAELAWQIEPKWPLTPIDALQIYALKTSPAFEAALYSGLRMAGPMGPLEELVPNFCRHLGVGFQILNDLSDWRGDDNNKLIAGQDALSKRPTVILALAWEAANSAEREEIRTLLEGDGNSFLRVERLRQMFSSLRVFEKASQLVEKSKSRAEALADELENDSIRDLLYFLIDNVLGEAEQPPPAPTLGYVPVESLFTSNS